MEADNIDEIIEQIKAEVDLLQAEIAAITKLCDEIIAEVSPHLPPGLVHVLVAKRRRAARQGSEAHCLACGASANACALNRQNGDGPCCDSCDHERREGT